MQTQKALALQKKSLYDLVNCLTSTEWREFLSKSPKYRIFLNMYNEYYNKTDIIRVSAFMKNKQDDYMFLKIRLLPKLTECDISVLYEQRHLRVQVLNDVLIPFQEHSKDDCLSSLIKEYTSIDLFDMKNDHLQDILKNTHTIIQKIQACLEQILSSLQSQYKEFVQTKHDSYKLLRDTTEENEEMYDFFKTTSTHRLQKIIDARKKIEKQYIQNNIDLIEKEKQKYDDLMKSTGIVNVQKLKQFRNNELQNDFRLIFNATYPDMVLYEHQRQQLNTAFDLYRRFKQLYTVFQNQYRHYYGQQKVFTEQVRLKRDNPEDERKEDFMKKLRLDIKKESSTVDPRIDDTEIMTKLYSDSLNDENVPYVCEITYTFNDTLNAPKYTYFDLSTKELYKFIETNPVPVVKQTSTKQGVSIQSGRAQDFNTTMNAVYRQIHRAFRDYENKKVSRKQSGSVLEKAELLNIQKLLEKRNIVELLNDQDIDLKLLATCMIQLYKKIIGSKNERVVTFMKMYSTIYTRIRLIFCISLHYKHKYNVRSLVYVLFDPYNKQNEWMNVQDRDKRKRHSDSMKETMKRAHEAMNTIARVVCNNNHTEMIQYFGYPQFETKNVQYFKDIQIVSVQYFDDTLVRSYLDGILIYEKMRNDNYIVCYDDYVYTIFFAYLHSVQKTVSKTVQKEYFLNLKLFYEGWFDVNESWDRTILFLIKDHYTAWVKIMLEYPPMDDMIKFYYHEREYASFVDIMQNLYQLHNIQGLSNNRFYCMIIITLYACAREKLKFQEIMQYVCNKNSKTEDDFHDGLNDIFETYSPHNSILLTTLVSFRIKDYDFFNEIFPYIEKLLEQQTKYSYDDYVCVAVYVCQKNGVEGTINEVLDKLDYPSSWFQQNKYDELKRVLDTYDLTKTRRSRHTKSGRRRDVKSTATKTDPSPPTSGVSSDSRSNDTPIRRPRVTKGSSSSSTSSEITRRPHVPKGSSSSSASNDATRRRRDVPRRSSSSSTSNDSVSKSRPVSVSEIES